MDFLVRCFNTNLYGKFCRSPAFLFNAEGDKTYWDFEETIAGLTSNADIFESTFRCLL